MNFDYVRRAKIALALLILLVFVSDAYFALTTHIFSHITTIPSDEVSLYERRLETLKQILPQRAFLGYVGDTYVGDTDDLRVELFNKRWFLTRYILAPLIIIRRADLPIVIGDFHDTHSYAVIPKSNGLVLMRDLGNGVQLFRRGAD